MSTTSTPTPPHRAMRADARRNEERLLAAATAAFAEHGVDAAMEDVARRAGVGIGTLYRHFPTREALAEAVYRSQIEALCAQAEGLLASPSPAAALATWLRAVVVHGTTKRGLAEFLKTTMRGDGSTLAWCKSALTAAGDALLRRAQQAGAVRPDVEIADLVRLASAIGWAADLHPVGVDRTDRFLALLMDGLRAHSSEG